MAQSLPQLPDWEQLSTNIVRILGGNPSKFTLQGTNTYLLGTGPRRILIDTGAGEQKWIDTLRSVLTSSSSQGNGKPITVSTCLLTHWHHDHLGGVRDLEKLCAELGGGSQQPGAGEGAVTVYKNQPTWNPDGLIDPERVHDIEDGQTFSIPLSEEGLAGTPFEIQAIHTPGHAKDHMVFQITSSPDPSEVGALFTADNVLGHGTAVFENLHQYLQSLDLMKRRVVDAVGAQQEQQGSSSSSSKRAFPGHGAVIGDAVAKIDEYIAHRRMREEEALNVLKYGTTTPPNSSEPVVHDSITRVGDGDSGEEDEDQAVGGGEKVPGKEWESLEMVKVIYRHYPENLWQPAESGLLMVLDKLRRDGKVVRTKEGRWRVSEKATL